MTAPTAPAPASATGRPRTAALFSTCLVEALFPGVGLAAVKVLRRLGVEPAVPAGQTCCGQPAFNAGYRREARAVALHFLEVFEPHEWVVSPSGSCVSMVREHYPRLFEGEPELRERCERLGPRVLELGEFLSRVLGASSTGARFAAPVKVAYHDSCHALRSLGLRDEPRRLIRGTEGVELVDLASSETCCGFGGLFSVKYPDISLAMVDDKVRSIETSGADLVVSSDASCLMHIGGALERRGSRVRTMHLAELLAQGL